MSKKSTVLGLAILLATAGFLLCLYDLSRYVEIMKNGGSHLRLAFGLFGFSLVLFIIGAFIDD